MFQNTCWASFMSPFLCKKMHFPLFLCIRPNIALLRGTQVWENDPWWCYLSYVSLDLEILNRKPNSWTLLSLGFHPCLAFSNNLTISSQTAFDLFTPSKSINWFSLATWGKQHKLFIITLIKLKWWKKPIYISSNISIYLSFFTNFTMLASC